MWRAKLRRATCESAVKGKQSPLRVQGGCLRVSQAEHPADGCSPPPASPVWGRPLRGPAAGICPERLGQPVRRPAPESCSFTHIVKEIKEQNSVPAPLCRPRCRAAPRAPRPGKQGPAVPPVGAARCHMAALPEARPRAGLRAAERGGGRGWPLASSLRARQRSSPARPTAASRTLPAGGRGRRGGRAREPRLGSLWFALLLCSPQTSFLERSWEFHQALPCC